MKLKRKLSALIEKLLAESEDRREAENLLNEARGQLAESILREAALADQVEKADGLRLVLERAIEALESQVRVSETLLRDAGVKVEWLSGEVWRGLMRDR